MILKDERISMWKKKNVIFWAKQQCLQTQKVDQYKHTTTLEKESSISHAMQLLLFLFFLGAMLSSPVVE